MENVTNKKRTTKKKAYINKTMDEKRASVISDIESYVMTTSDVIDTVVGTQSEDIYKENKRFMMSTEEREQNLYKELLTYKKYGEVLWGTLCGVEDKSDYIDALVSWNNIMVRIPDSLFFEDTYRFGTTYESLSDNDKLKKRRSTLSFMLGAKVCFIPTVVEREVILDKYDVMYGKYEMRIAGDRKKAMAVLRDIYFFHNNRKSSTIGTMREIKVDQIVNARIIQVKEENILVECGGVESRIAARYISGDRYYRNCMDAYSPGDSIKVRVKKVFVDRENMIVKLGLTGQLAIPSQAIKKMKIGSTYQGEVISVNHEKHSYLIRLPYEIPCTVFFEFVFGHIVLFPGDRVNVYITNIYDTFVSGSASKA